MTASLTAGIRDLSNAKVVGYCRVSTERQAGEKQTSLPDQQRAIEQKAVGLGYSRVDEWFVDAGASGGMMEQRPGMAELLAACGQHPRAETQPGVLVVLNATRWGRLDDPEDAAYWRVHFKRLGWIVQYAEHDESSDPTTRTLMRAINDAQSSATRRAIRDNARRGARGTAEQGYWRGRAPFGYRRSVVYPPGREAVLENGRPKAPDEKVSLTPHTEEAALVRQMFTMYASGEHSLSSVAAMMIQAIPERTWEVSVLSVMLRNEAYVGDVVGGRRPSDPTKKGRGATRPASEWYGKREAHEPIVDRTTFLLVQARLAENARTRRGSRAEYVVTGLLSCATCRSHIVGGGLGGTARLRKLDGERSRFYKCSAGLKDRHACAGKLTTVSKHTLEDAVVRELSRTIGSAAVRKHLEAAIDRFVAGQAGSADGESKAHLRALTAAVKQRERLVAAIATGTLTEREAAPKMGALRVEIDRLKALHEQGRFAVERAKGVGIEREAILRLAADFPAVARQTRGKALRELVRPWLAGGTFDKHTRELTLYIRRLPATGGLSGPSLPSSNSPERDGQQKGTRDVIVRRVMVSGAGRRDTKGRWK